MKNLGIMLKTRRVLPFRTQLHFSSVFFHLNRQFTALEAVRLFQPSQRLGLWKILYSDKIWTNQELGMWETYSLPPFTGKLWKTSLPGLPQWVWQAPHTLCCAKEARGSTSEIPHTGLPTGWRVGDKEGFGEHCREAGRELEGRDEERQTVEGRMAAESGL